MSNKPRVAKKKEAPKKKTAKKIELIVPVEYNGETVNSITMRRIKGRDLMQLDKHSGSEMEAMLEGLLPDLIDFPADFVEELDAEDVLECIEVIEVFLGRKVAQA